MNRSITLTVVTIIASSFACGCALGPLAMHETARSVGKAKNEFDYAFGSMGHMISWNVGASDDLDVGIHLESLSIGIRAKYAFINARENGWSLAAAAGVGSSFGGGHYYGDVISSYLSEFWEPYGALRLTHAHNDPIYIKDRDNSRSTYTFSAGDYDYGAVILGSRFWLSERWMASIEASSLFSAASNVTFGSNVLASAAFGYRF